MIRKITSADKEVFFSLTEQFYQSDAVLHPIPAVCHERTFEELMRSYAYLEHLILKQYGSDANFRMERMPDNQRAVKLYARMGYEPLTYVQMVKNKRK